MKTKIWTLPTRIFHWLLAGSFVITYVLGEIDTQANLHFAFGALAGGLIFFRILYGFIGPRYSLFKDFPMGLKNQKTFIKNLISAKSPKAFIGHNPVASVIMLSILVTGLVCSISGYYLYAAENQSTIAFLSEDMLEEVHEITAALFLTLVVFHLIGLAVETFRHKEVGTLTSMFHGYKNVDAETVRLNLFQQVFNALWFTIPFVLFYLALALPITKSHDHDDHSPASLLESDDSDDDD